MNTSRYSTCDLKDNPEQLCDDVRGRRRGRVVRSRERYYTGRLHLLEKNQNGRQMGEIGC